MRLIQTLLFTAGVLLISSAAVATEPLTDSRVTLKNNVLQFQGAPGFSLQVPAGTQFIKRSAPASQVAALRAPDGVVIEASVAKVGSTLKLANAGLRYFDVLRRVVGKEHRFVLHQPVTLPDSRTGYRSDIEWVLTRPNQAPIRLHSTVISVIKDGTWVFIAVHPQGRSQRYIDVATSIRLTK